MRRGPGLAAEAELPLDALRIGHLDGDLYDPRCVWVRQRQIAPDGAILVRRTASLRRDTRPRSEDPRAALGAALSQILLHPAEASVGSPV